MADPIKERLERRNEQHDLIREQVEIETLRDGSQQAATVRNRDVARSQDAAKTRVDLTRVSESTRSDTPKTDKAAPTEKPPEKPPTGFKIADGRDLEKLMAGRPQPKAPPAEAAQTRRADARAETRAPRPAAETSRPPGATRIAEGRAVQGRREAAITERPRNDQIPREQLRPGNQKPLTTAQRQGLVAQMRAYMAKLLRPSKPASADGMKNLHAGVAHKKAAGGLPLSKTGPLPKGTSSPTSGSPALASKGPFTAEARDKSPVIEAGKILAFDGQAGDAETQAQVCDRRDAFCRLGAGESPLVFDAGAWHEVQQERSRPIQVRIANNGNADHRRVEALRGRQAKT
ncbi:MAG: hypothetical protein HYT76_07440 [Deltaproteobacteria bacterium]|nr:hypothetical protein [Deltaproteobacteria bacterium]